MSMKNSDEIIVTEYEWEQIEENFPSEDEVECENYEHIKSETLPFIAQNDSKSLKNKKNRKYPKTNPNRFYDTCSKNGFNQHTTKKRFLLYIFVGISFIILTHQMTLLSHPSRIYIVSGWEPNQTRNVSDYIFPEKNTIITDAINICNKNDGNIFLLIIVSSSAENFDARNAIRKTWANYSEFNYKMFDKIHSEFKGDYLPINKTYSTNENALVRTIFIVGDSLSNEINLEIKKESNLYNDIIQESFLDSYNNLTIKTVMMLKWIHSICSGEDVRFIMKCDDDTFVNVPNLIHILLGGTVPAYEANKRYFGKVSVHTLSNRARLQQHKELLLGRKICHAKPIKNVLNKWYAPSYMYNKPEYPRYLSGTGYVMSIDAAISLYRIALKTRLFHLEDVYLTGICASKAHIKLTNHHLFTYLPGDDLCEYRAMITIHKNSPIDMDTAYEFVTNNEYKCLKPKRSEKFKKTNSFLDC